MWFITVVEKMDAHPKIPDLPDTGETRAFGFFSDKSKAVRSLHENWYDMHESCYDYAVIEEYEEGIFNDTGKRQWFKWDNTRSGFFEIEEPELVKYIRCFAMG